MLFRCDTDLSGEKTWFEYQNTSWIQVDSDMDISLLISHNSLWQTQDWQDFLRASSWTACSTLLLEMQSSEVIVFGFFEKRSLGLGMFGLFCVGGPIGGPSDEFVAGISQTAQDLDCVMVQCEPLDPMQLSSFRSGVPYHFIEPHTARIDLSQSLDEMLSAMKQKGRYNIRVAKKHDISVEVVEPTRGHVSDFYALL